MKTSGRFSRLVRGEDAGTARHDERRRSLRKPSLDARKEVLAVQVSRDRWRNTWSRSIARARGDPRITRTRGWRNGFRIGASPRGTLALDRARAPMRGCDGRDTATPDDVQAVAHACLRHRLIVSYEAEAEGITRDAVLDEVLKLVAVLIPQPAS